MNLLGGKFLVLGQNLTLEIAVSPFVGFELRLRVHSTIFKRILKGDAHGGHLNMIAEDYLINLI